MRESALPGWRAADTVTVQELEWYAVRTMSNRERVVAGFLNGKGIEACVPIHAPRLEPHGRRRERVLFPGYVFCSFDPSKLLPIVTVPGVVGVVCSGRKPAAVEPHEMRAIMRLMESGLPSEPHPYLSTGERVRVRLGPLTGVEGVLIREGRNERIVISVSLLMSSVMVEIERSFVEPVKVRAHAVRQLAMARGA